MIELAPNSKRGLALAGPLILSGGYGGEWDRALLEQAHALLTLPITLRPRSPALSRARLQEFPGGFLLNRHDANPGFAAVLRAQRHLWRRIKIPVVLTLAAGDAAHWMELARRAARIESISALELELAEEVSTREAVGAVRATTSLPLIAKLPLEHALETVEAVLAAGADAVCVGLAPSGQVVRTGEVWEGRLNGPALRPLTLRVLRAVAERFAEVPLIGAGGIHNADDVREFLHAGARAVEIDTVLWRDPRVFDAIAKEFTGVVAQ